MRCSAPPARRAAAAAPVVVVAAAALPSGRAAARARRMRAGGRAPRRVRHPPAAATAKTEEPPAPAARSPPALARGLLQARRLAAWATGHLCRVRTAPPENRCEAMRHGRAWVTVQRPSRRQPRPAGGVQTRGGRARRASARAMVLQASCATASPHPSSAPRRLRHRPLRVATPAGLPRPHWAARQSAVGERARALVGAQGAVEGEARGAPAAPKFPPPPPARAPTCVRVPQEPPPRLRGPSAPD